MAQVVRMAEENVARGQRPYAALVVADGDIVGEGVNTVLADGDPTAHAETQAVRDACARRGSRTLGGAHLISSCHPCVMCQAVTQLAGIGTVYYAGPCMSRSTVVRPDLTIELAAVPSAARPFELFEQTGLVLLDDPALT
ncbi:nucleoside deaminase [Phytoactinopolyspora alkaliphila]|uniref:Nucleoside deaminase n=2 Tax=Phytoactinopolyspora alkaliphila TaxID=1783498 RepID=A0A6N9YJP2_9ACTN|nr:nucleoside deaminase [Phytoactinopolyspora alkaliphila]